MRGAAQIGATAGLMEVGTTSTGARVADVGIIPDVREFSSFDFDAIPEMYERGRSAAELKIPEILELLTTDAWTGPSRTPSTRSDCASA